jgi:dTDP-4-dehydrorhamnose reductase
VTSGPVLITGGGGQLASELAPRYAEEGEVHAPTHAELDIADAEAVDGVFASVRPGLVLNCAAFHNVDACERDEHSAWEVNVRAVRHLAQHCAEHGATFVHLSTNYVFDGRRLAPYLESDLPAPRSVYALTKLAGEHAALAYAPDALVVRSAGLYGLHGSRSKGGNFVQRMIARAREQGALKMVADQRLTPTFTGDLADGIHQALERGVRGVLHLTNAGACSWLEFTEAIMETAGIEVPIEPVETTLGPGQIDRPLNGVLASEVSGLDTLRPWREALDDYMARAGLAATPRT